MRMITPVLEHSGEIMRYAFQAILVFVTVSVYYFCHKKTSRRQLACVGTLMAVFGLIAIAASGHMLPLRDEVILTALGERCPEAAAEEIAITGFMVDGTEYVPEKDLEIIDGKWGWQNGMYIWRIESDVRQPAGVTRSITVGIPVGRERQLCFVGGLYSGKVELSLGDQIKTIDTFSADGSSVTCDIGGSRNARLLENEARYFAVFGVTYILLLGASYAVCQFYRRHHEMLERSWDIYVYIALGIFCLAALHFYHSYNDMFWGDEMLGILAAAKSSLKDAIYINRTNIDVTPPLFNIIIYYASKLLPHTYEALLWIPHIFYFLGIVLLGAFLGRTLGKAYGVAAAIFAATSPNMIISMGCELRSYSLFFLLSGLTLYAYYCRLLNNNRYSFPMLLALLACYTGLSMCHYFGIVIIGIYFLIDVCLCFKKRCDARYIISYIVPGVLFAAWGIFVMTNDQGNIYNPPPLNPTIWNLLQLLRFWFSSNILLISLFFVSVVYLVANRKRIYERFSTSPKYFIFFVSVLLVVLTVMAAYVASFATSLMKYRYFSCLWPPLVCIVLFALKMFLSEIKGKRLPDDFHLLSTGKRTTRIVLASAFLILGYTMHVSVLHDMGEYDERVDPDTNNRRMPYLDILPKLRENVDIAYQRTGVFFQADIEEYEYLVHDDEILDDINIEFAWVVEWDVTALEKYDTLYCVYYSWDTVNVFGEYDVIKNEFVLVEDDPTLGIAKYVRV